MSSGGTVPDSERRGWMAAMPARLRPFASLARFDRPIGAWLLYWPGAWAIALSGYLADGGWTVRAGAGSDWPLLVWFAIGAIAMRGAGCVYNDIVDRELDAKVARTRDRPLASGQVSLRAAWIWIGILCLIGLGVLTQVRNSTAALVAVASVLPVAAYPFMKRITWWPQAWLGLVFSWGALPGWAASQPGLDGALWYDGPNVAWPIMLPGLLLYAGSVFWVIGYDTIYALQDIEDDALAGVRSSARALGRHARAGIAVCYLLALAGWVSCFAVLGAGWPALLALVAVAAHFAWQVVGLRPADPADALRRFRSNRTAGLLMFLACLLAGASTRL